MATTSNISGSKVIPALRQVVADSYALLGQTHLCHWNVRGPSFFALHNAFEEQYTELFQAVDEIAERIRALGAFAPGGLGTLSQMAGFPEIPEDSTAEVMVTKLLESHQKTIEAIGEAREAAADSGDKETEDLMIARIQVHEKTSWMLRSYLES
ncbi:MAG: Dps family protein [Puniceicoccaceae bacterium]